MSSTDELRAQLEAFCSEQLGTSVKVTSLDRFSGGASRETWSFVADDGSSQRKLVLRRDPVGAPARSDRSGEVVLLEAAEAAGVPVPKVLWTTDFGSPGFIMEHVDGETIARRILRDDE